MRGRRLRLGGRAGWDSITLVDPHARVVRGDGVNDIDPTRVITETDPAAVTICHVRVQLFAHIILTIRVDPASGSFVLQRADARSMSPRVHRSLV